MPQDLLAAQLDQVESRFALASTALLTGTADDVQTSSLNLQKSAVEILQLVEELGQSSLDKQLHAKRLQALAAGISVLRENLLRRAAFVEQGLQILLPAAKRPTYSPGAGPYGNGGANGFKVVTA